MLRVGRGYIQLPEEDCFWLEIGICEFFLGGGGLNDPALHCDLFGSHSRCNNYIDDQSIPTYLTFSNVLACSTYRNDDNDFA